MFSESNEYIVMSKYGKTLWVLAMLMATAATSLAQDSTKANTLFGNRKGQGRQPLGFFVAPGYQTKAIDGSASHLLLVRAGITLGNQWSIGGYFNTSLGEIRPKNETAPNTYLDYRSYGGFVEYTAWAKKMVHLSFPVLVGVGEIELDNEAGAANFGEANFFKVEPSALLEVNLHKHIRLQLGAGYRFVSNVQYRHLTQADLSGLVGHAALKFGLFR